MSKILKELEELYVKMKPLQEQTRKRWSKICKTTTLSPKILKEYNEYKKSLLGDLYKREKELRKLL